MKQTGIYILLLCLLTAGCEKKPSADDVKTHLEKAMTDHLLQGRQDDAPPPHFQITDVAYFKIGEWYRCQFTVKLTLPDGTDTSGFIQGKISTDYATVIK